MFNVPSVTMNGGSLMRVTSRPLSSAEQRARARRRTGSPAPAARRASTANLVITMQPSAITMPHDRSMPAGEDDQRLADGDHADHHHLLQDQREVLARQEAVALRGEEHAREQQRDQRADVASDGRRSAKVAWPAVRKVRLRHDAAAVAGGIVRRASAPRWRIERLAKRAAAWLTCCPSRGRVPNFVSLLSTPAIGLSVISVTPVSV